MALKAREIHEHFCTVGTWVDWQGGTCDGFKHGDPDAEVMGIAVGWQSLLSSLEEAHDRGCNLFITHEPTFYSHMDDDPAMMATSPARRKRAFLDRTGLVVYRCHDVWDRFPERGIIDAWSDFLQLGEPVRRDGYYRLHELPSTTAWEVAQRIGRRVAELGEQMVQFMGPRHKMVQRLAIGTGAITDVRRMVDLGADLLLTTDDGVVLWRDGAWVADLGLPMIIVNHMTSEIPGLRQLAAYLGEQYPQVPVEFVGPTCSYEIMATERSQYRPIHMRRESLADLPPLVVPQGYDLRPMEEDEVWAYVEVMNESNFSGEADRQWFEKTFVQDPEYDPSYLQLIWRGDRPVAAAGAWHREVDGTKCGMIHWVGVARAERGTGLGKAVTLAALHRLRERGFGRAVLTTGVWRLPAVAAYLRLGFRPWLTDDAPQDLWDEVLEHLADLRRGGSRA